MSRSDGTALSRDHCTAFVFHFGHARGFWPALLLTKQTWWTADSFASLRAPATVGKRCRQGRECNQCSYILDYCRIALRESSKVSCIVVWPKVSRKYSYAFSSLLEKVHGCIVKVYTRILVQVRHWKRLGKAKLAIFVWDGAGSPKGHAKTSASPTFLSVHHDTR